jgi:rhamnogalacturonyl hydrolase YesR
VVERIDFALRASRYFEAREERYANGPYHFLWKHRELDHFAIESAAMLDVMSLFPDRAYGDYLKRSEARWCTGQARLADGTLARTWPHVHTIWADDLMAMIYPARVTHHAGDPSFLEDAVRQVRNFNKYLWNPSTGLFHHAYYADLSRVSGAHWGRCNGWIMLGTTHVLDALPPGHPSRDELVALLTRHVLGVARYQSASGLWHQLLDKPDSYLESSCTALFTYCVARAINRGWLDERYAGIALAGWHGLCRDKITVEGVLKDICVGTGIGNDLVFYYNRPTRDNDIHGLGPIIEAGLEIVALKKLLSASE